MQLPLTQWMLHAKKLPERFLDAPQPRAFSLPGADALSEFAELLGVDAQEAPAQPESRVPYALEGMFEADLTGELSLTREIDFGALNGDRALLTFAHLCGSGEIILGDRCVARFGSDWQDARRQAYDMTGMPCALTVDVSDALRLGRCETLCIHFDAQRPAGVIGAAFLSTMQCAHLSRVSIQPDTLRRTMTVRARISAQDAGRYVLRVQAVPGRAQEHLPPARETDMELASGETRGMQLALNVDAPVFVPGHVYDAPALKIQLYKRSENEKGEGILCDEALLQCGYPAAAPRAYLPLSQADCLDDPKNLCDRLCELGVYAVSLPQYMPERLYIEMTKAGIAAVQHVSEEMRPMFTRYPCLALSDVPLDEQTLSPAAAAWQMAGSVAFVRALDPEMTDEEMLLEVSGRTLDQDATNVQEALLWLRAVQIRMRAEAVRQRRYQGALCRAEDILCRDMQDALHTAFSPVHLSALPLSGAWWTGTRFSASLEAFFPEGLCEEEKIQVCAVLEDDDGMELARFTAPCRRSGYVGVIEAQLPDAPCVLTLRCALLQGERAIEENMLPVYVGERGPLEAAF